MKTTTKIILAGITALCFQESFGQGNSLGGVNPGGTTATYNTVYGDRVGVPPNMTGPYNTFVGSDVGSLITSGSQNVFIGSQAGSNQTTASWNVFVGHSAGRFNTSGFSNTFLGTNSGSANTTGQQNTFTGVNSGWVHTTGNYNVFNGALAGNTSTTGSYNVFLGHSSGRNNVTGNAQTFVGYQSCYNTTASNNSALGYQAGFTNVTGTNNTYIGLQADAAATYTALTNTTALGYSAKVTASNNMILGDNNVNVGIGISGVAGGAGNKLDINTSNTATTANGYSGTSTGFSGLRFRDITTASTPAPNQFAAANRGVLSVDANGDVILVTANNIGNNCGATSNPLPNDYEVPLGGYNFLFTGQGLPSTSVNTVSVGYTCGTPTMVPAKFSVLEQNSSTIAVTSYAGSFINKDQSSVSSTAHVGVSGVADANQSMNCANVGVYGIGSNCATSIGVKGEANSASITGSRFGGRFSAISSYSGTNYAVYGTATGTANINYSGYFLSQTGNTGTNYGIYAKAQNATTANYAGYFDGDVYVNGPTSGVGYLTVSDRRFKTDVKEITNAMDLIKQFKSKTYNFISENEYGMNLPKQKQYGFIAQEVEAIVPEFVSDLKQPEMKDEDGKVKSKAIDYKAVNYIEFIPLLVAGMQEQQEIIADLQEQIKDLTAMIAPAKESDVTETTKAVTLADKKAVVLDQNVPNPFAEKTVINYNIPLTVSKAQILFFNAEGKLIQTADIATTGAGQLTVFANDLSNGVYSYSLIADGKVLDTKKMIKQ